MVKVLLAPLGTEGDVRPLLAMGRALKERGCFVSVCSTEDFKTLSKEQSFNFYPLEYNFRRTVEDNKDILGSGISGAVRFRNNLKEIMELNADILEDLIKSSDLVLGSGLQLNAFSICEKYNKKYFHILFAPNFAPSKKHTPPQVPFHISNGVINSVIWFFFKRIINKAVIGDINRFRKMNNLDGICDIFEYLRDKAIFSFSKELTSLPGDLWDLKTLPYFDLDDKKLPDNVEEFISNGTKPVFIGFGSMPGDEKKLNFIKKAIMDLDLRAVIQRGWAGFEACDDGRFLYVGDISHTRLFPKMRFIVHHGGAGTTLNASKSGVPQLVIPHFMDQFYWGNIVYSKGLGPKPVKYNNILTKKIKNRFEDILKNESYSYEALKVRKKIEIEMNDESKIDFLLNFL